jgi:hypothetical protein
MDNHNENGGKAISHEDDQPARTEAQLALIHAAMMVISSFPTRKR